MKTLAFRNLLRWKKIILPILTASLIHFSLKGWENVLVATPQMAAGTLGQFQWQATSSACDSFTYLLALLILVQ